MAAQRSRRGAADGGSLRAGQIAAWALSNVIKGAGQEVALVSFNHFVTLQCLFSLWRLQIRHDLAT